MLRRLTDILAVVLAAMWTSGCGDASSTASRRSGREAYEQIVQVTTAQEFADRVLGADKPVLVDFYATWCVPCQQLAPTIGELADEYKGRAEFVKVDVDKSPELTARYRVSASPTVVVFRGGKPAGVLVGPRDAGEYRAALDAAISAGGGT